MNRYLLTFTVSPQRFEDESSIDRMSDTFVIEAGDIFDAVAQVKNRTQGAGTLLEPCTSLTITAQYDIDSGDEWA